MNSRVKLVLVVAILVIALVGSIVVALNVGAAQTTSEIVLNIRAPRLVMTVAVGAGLAVAGVVMQGAFRNPLADPAIIGVSGAAALGAVIAAGFGIAFNTALTALTASIGAFIAVIIVSWVAKANGRSEVVTLILAGVAVMTFTMAVLGVLVSVNTAAQVRSLSFWSAGSFALATWSGVIATLPFIVIGAIIAMVIAHSLNVLALGDRDAQAVGINVERTRIAAMIAVVLLVAAGVAVVGVIAFVGLVVAHVMRAIVGPRHGPLIATSALAGALLLVIADTAARTLANPVEIPIGAITTIIGAPVLFFLIWKYRSRQGGWA